MRRRQEETAFHVPFLRLSFGDLFSLLSTCQEKRLVVVYNLVSAGARSLFLPVLSELAWRRKAHFRFRLSYPPLTRNRLWRVNLLAGLISVIVRPWPARPSAAQSNSPRGLSSFFCSLLCLVKAIADVAPWPRPSRSWALNVLSPA